MIHLRAIALDEAERLGLLLEVVGLLRLMNEPRPDRSRRLGHLVLTPLAACTVVELGSLELPREVCACLLYVACTLLTRDVSVGHVESIDWHVDVVHLVIILEVEPHVQGPLGKLSIKGLEGRTS